MIRRNLFAAVVAPFVSVASAIKTEKKSQRCSCGNKAKLRMFSMNYAPYPYLHIIEYPLMNVGFRYTEYRAVCEICDGYFAFELSNRLNFIINSKEGLNHPDAKQIPGVFTPFNDVSNDSKKVAKEKYYQRLNS